MSHIVFVQEVYTHCTVLYLIFLNKNKLIFLKNLQNVGLKKQKPIFGCFPNLFSERSLPQKNTHTKEALHDLLFPVNVHAFIVAIELDVVIIAAPFVRP